MLHEAQRTVAPSACSVSTSTAVWIVMCRLPVTRAPFSGWLLAYSARIAISAGISLSAMRISLRPQSASDRSATAYWSVCRGFNTAFIERLHRNETRRRRVRDELTRTEPAGERRCMGRIQAWGRDTWSDLATLLGTGGHVSSVRLRPSTLHSPAPDASCGS